jgi:hypothetical protein
MSVIHTNNITNKDGTSGPTISGITTVSSTGFMQVPVGNNVSKFTRGAISDNLIFYFDPTYDECYAQPKAGGTQPVNELTGYHPTSIGTPSAGTTYNSTFRALNLDGVSSDIQFNSGNNPELSPTDVTVETWFRMDGTPGGGFHPFFQKNGGFSGGAVFGNRCLDLGLAYFMVCIDTLNTGSRSHFATNQGVLSRDVWYQMVGVYEAQPVGLKYSRSRIYFNGVFTDEKIWDENNVLESGGVKDTRSIPPLIGGNQYHIGNGDARNMNGDIAIVRVYGRALSASEINQNFQVDRGRFGL